MNNEFTRSSTDCMIGGVCGGLARYLNLDVTWIRLFFVLIALGDGIGVMLYFILWLIMPDEDHMGQSIQQNVHTNMSEMGSRMQNLGTDIHRAAKNPPPQTAVLAGGAMIIAGFFWLVDSLNITWLHWLSFDTLWPILLIIGGVALVLRQSKQGGQNERTS